jgi:hypothetical protein
MNEQVSEVWTAVALYPESTEVMLADTESALLREIVATIGRDEYDAFVACLLDAEATDVTFDDDPSAVLRVWAGEREDADDGGYYVGDSWLVRLLPIAS